MNRNTKFDVMVSEVSWATEPVVPLNEMGRGKCLISVDNNLSSLVPILKSMGYKAEEVELFNNLPKRRLVGNNKPNKIWKDLAIHRSMNTNNTKYFITNNAIDFEGPEFNGKGYHMISISGVVSDYKKLANKISNLLMHSKKPKSDFGTPSGKTIIRN